MNLETINKWLDEEYGCSYTKLEELHDWLVEENIKLKDENQQLKKQKDDVVEYIKENKNKTIAPYGDNEDTDYEVCLFEEDINDLLRMLGEIDEYQEKEKNI